MEKPPSGTALDRMLANFPELRAPIEKALTAAPEIIQAGSHYIERRFTDESGQASYAREYLGRQLSTADLDSGWRTWFVLKWAIERDLTSREKACAVIVLVHSLGITNPEQRARLPVTLRADIDSLHGPLLNGNADKLAMAADGAWDVIDSSATQALGVPDLAADLAQLTQTMRDILRETTRAVKNGRGLTRESLVSATRAGNASMIDNAIRRMRKPVKAGGFGLKLMNDASGSGYIPRSKALRLGEELLRLEAEGLPKV